VASEDEGRLIALLERAGARAGAVAVYKEFSRRLAQEYEVAPSAETQALIARVREVRFMPEPRPASRGAPSSGGDGATAGVIVVCVRRTPR
jgi:DNA-binding SARP family transcriptional activator